VSARTLLRAAALLGLAVLALSATPRAASAHGMRTAFLELDEVAPGRAAARFRTTLRDSALIPRFPDGCRIVKQKDSSHGLANVGFYVLECDGPLAGRVVGMHGLGPVVTEAVVLVTLAGGELASHVLTRDSPTWELPRGNAWVDVARPYVRMGIEHILSGADHLLFLLLLVLTLKRPKPVLWAETAFTASHSISFSATALGWIAVSPLAAEACIALSLVLVALDVGREPSLRSTSRRGAAVAFVFGLVHGLGFAGGLAEAGLPDMHIGHALLGFALGVEIGQVAFLVVALVAVGLLMRTRLGRPLALVAAFAIGAVSSLWLIERVWACVHPA
jgi:hypothetical protein